MERTDRDCVLCNARPCFSSRRARLHARLLPFFLTRTHTYAPCSSTIACFFQSTFSRRFSSPCFGSAEQGWQADSFAFRRIKATFPPWQPVLFCHLIARASHFSGQPLLLDRPLSLPIILSVYSALPPPRHAAPLSYQCNYFFWQAIHQP